MNYQAKLKLLLFFVFTYSSQPKSEGGELGSSTIILYKDSVFCNQKVVVNWKQDFEAFCLNDNSNKVIVMADRKSNTDFVTEVVSFVQNKMYSKNSPHQTKVTLLRDNALKKKLARCLSLEECRSQRNVRAGKGI